MNKSRLIGGIICLLIAGFLTIANLRLPAEDLMFTVGDRNMPWVPVVVLVVVGIGLVIAAFSGQEKEQPAEQPEIEIDPGKAALNKRLETIGWGLFLVMLGGFILIPVDVINRGIWSIGIGLIMIGLNAARYFNQMRMSGFTTFLGVVSLLGGIAQLMGWYALEGALFFIILGAYLLLKPWFDKRQLFGKAEAS